MEYLEIKQRPGTAFRRGLGIVLILLAIALFISTFGEDQEILHLFFPAALVLKGVYDLFNGFGLERSWLRTGSDFITIKWSNKLNPVTIHIAGIREITLTRFSVSISCKSRKPLKLDIGYLDLDQKKELYQFLVDYATKRDLKLVRNY
jgi:hypothetical protein